MYCSRDVIVNVITQRADDVARDENNNNNIDDVGAFHRRKRQCDLDRMHQ